MILNNLIIALRPHHWIKNIFIFVVPILHFKILDLHYLINLFLTFICFCFFSSAGYVLNDWFDRFKDKLHPIKKHRPFSSGKLNFYHMLMIFTFLASAGLIILLNIKGNTQIIVIIYFITTILYSSFFKNFALLDITVISLGFVLRLMSGALSTSLEVSIELLVITFFLCIFFPLSKRRDDLQIGLDEEHRYSLKNYNKKFLDNLIIICLVSSITVIILWSVSSETENRLGTDALPLLVPFFFIGICRYLQLIFVLKNSSDPVFLLFNDKFLQIIIGIIIFLFGLIRFLNLSLKKFLI